MIAPDGEGSVEVDGMGYEFDDDDGEDTTRESDDSAEESSDEGGSTTTQPQQTEPAQEGEQPDPKQEKTDKGTKLAEDPMQRANQLRANAEARAREYEEFLNDPVKVEAYLKELRNEQGGTEPQPQTDTKVIRPEDIRTVEDVQAYASQLQRQFDERIAKIEKQYSQDKAVQGRVAVNERVTRNIADVQSKYPQLREFNPDGSKNPDFDAELDRELGELYEELDFDPKAQSFRGQVDLIKLADRFMKVRQRGETNGSKKAQTIVKDRREGRINSGTTAGTGGSSEEGMTPAQKIAARMQKARGNR